MFITSRAAQYMHRICTVGLMPLIRHNCNKYRNIVYIYIYIYKMRVYQSELL